MPSHAGTEVTLPTARSAGNPQSDAELLVALPLFATLSEASRQRLLGAASVRCYAAGTKLFSAGDAPVGLFVILEGRARVLRARNGRQRVIHSEGPGGTLGEVPLFEGGVLPATAEAVTSLRCLLIGKDALLALIHDDPSIAMLFLRRLAARVRSLVDRLDQEATLPVVSRLAAFTLNRSEASRSSSSFSLGMTQEELAEELGTVREVVVRGLAQLRQEAVLGAAGRGRFSVLDVEKLRRLAGS
jgi:CRP-like cAMP-binding protein